jgi:DNA repair protein RadC
MSNHNLFTVTADGTVAPASSEAILSAARQVLAHRVRRGAALQSPQKTGEYLTARLGSLDYEVFGLILLDLCGAAAYAKSLLYSAAFA